MIFNYRNGFVLGVDGTHGYALLSWIDGSDVDQVSDADIDAAIVFLAAIHGLLPRRGRPNSRRWPRLERQIERHLARFRDAARGLLELFDFIDNSVTPRIAVESPKARRTVMAAGLAFDAELPQEWRTLVPSDFGFHDSLRRPDELLAFLDFEYFGWDDPMKLAADILLHPGRPLEPPQRKHFRQAATRLYGNDPAFASRLSAYLPLFGLRRVLIMLNEFFPERSQRRMLAGETGSWSDVKARQLAHARAFLASLAEKLEA